MDQESKIYPYQDALKASTEYFNGDTLAATVFLNKYALKDSDGNLYERTPEDMHHRLAKEFARIESHYSNPMTEEEIFGYLKNFKYIVPAGSPMAGIGNDFQKYVSLSNCFVIESPYDSFGGINYACNHLSSIMKRRGGCGIDISTLRPEGAAVNNSARTSSGTASFMQLFSTVTQTIGQNSRRGALMLSLSARCIDSLKFINAKQDLSKVTGANISVRLDDEFMQAVEDDGDYELRFPVDSETPQYTKTIKARDLWKNIIHNAWATAEPGVLFWDTIIKQGIVDDYAEKYPELKTISTNPCAELPLASYSQCRLNTLNLFGFVVNPFTPEAYFDFDKLKECARVAQRMLDDLVDLDFEKVNNILEKIDNDPDPEYLKEHERSLWKNILHKGEMERRTGLGITAEGDMLAALGIKYGTPEATEFAKKVQQAIAVSAFESSVEMARERGCFPVFDYEIEKNNPFLNRLYDLNPELRTNMQKNGRRNIACLTIAPTGSVSLMTQTTSGIEPVFMPVYKRRRKVNPNDAEAHVDFVDEHTGESFEEYIVFHPKFKTWMQINGYNTEKRYSQKEIDELVSKSPYAGATANDIDWKEKVHMQGEIQKYVDHSISVTINLPENVSEELVDELYRTAWKSGCKGCTVYRDNCRAGVLVSATKKKEDATLPKIIEERPKSLAADVIRFKNNKENWIAFVGKLEDGRPYEIFTGLLDDEEGIIEIPKSIEHGHIVKNVHENGTKSYNFVFTNKRGTKVIIEAINNSFGEYANYSKMLSSVLRYNMPMNYVFHLVDSLDLKEDDINSWKSGVKRALKKFIKDGTTVVGSNDRCPDCGEKLIFQDGCVLCPNCGYSKCG